MLDDWTMLLDTPQVKHIESVGLDFSKAFDRLQPNILVHKLLKAEMNTHIVELIHNFLSNRRQCVNFNGHFSTYLDVVVGSPQGTKLGPILWLLYSNDLTSKTTDVHCVKYADDVTFYSANCVQPAIDRAIEWASNNSMLLNATKTVVLYVSLCNNVSTLNLVIDSQVLTPSPTVKFLGILIDSKLTFKDHVQSIISKSNSRLYFMRVLKRQGLNTKGLKTFYITNVRPILTYASAAWFSLCSKQSRAKLEQVQRTATRIILPSEEGYENRLSKLDLCSIETHIRESSQQHFHNILSNPDHPLHKRLTFNKNRTSSRVPSTFRPP
jgi:hypothetical protein